MSLVRDMAVAGQVATAPFEEETVRNLRTNVSFRAKVSPIEDMALNTELGRDPRAAVIFYVRDRSVLAGTLPGDKVLALGSTFEILPANDPDNPASLHLEFHGKIVSACDT